jgi:hypothetical protein
VEEQAFYTGCKETHYHISGYTVGETLVARVWGREG